MPSFDIVNALQMNEVDNALNQANKELVQRYDFKGSNSTIELKDKEIVIESSDDYKVQASLDVLQTKWVKRGLSLKSMDPQKIEPASGGRARQKVKLLDGIETEKAKELVKLIKETKLKIQVAIQGDMVRVTGKKKDDLQEAIQTIKGFNFSLPITFTNFRE